MTVQATTIVGVMKTQTLCFRLISRPYLLGLHNRLRISKKSYDQKYNDLRELRYKYKVCCLCNTKGAHRISEKEWYCGKHKAENDKLNREMGPMLSNVIVASAKMEAEENERVV